MKLFCHTFLKWCVLFQILRGDRKGCCIPSDNIGYMLLSKMGWTGGGVGKDNSGSVPQLLPLVGYDDRAGIGFGRPLAFALAIKHIIVEFIQSGCHDELVFSTELTSEERETIFAEARKNHLRSRCNHRGSTGEDVYAVVNMHRPPIELVNYLLENGGENNKYSLLPPSKVQL